MNKCNHCGHIMTQFDFVKAGINSASISFNDGSFVDMKVGHSIDIFQPSVSFSRKGQITLVGPMIYDGTSMSRTFYVDDIKVDIYASLEENIIDGYVTYTIESYTGNFAIVDATNTMYRPGISSKNIVEWKDTKN